MKDVLPASAGQLGSRPFGGQEEEVASPDQIAGAVLEEAVLSVLTAAGFNPLEDLTGDACINPGKPAVTIRGRGTDHQIDVVADPVVGYAFSNPARLLIEAKAYSGSRKVKLDVVRNAVGTLKDVSEFWRPSGAGTGGARRYHYRYAIFASTEFTKGAQEYAFAQDVYLLPLRRSAFFRPVVQAVDSIRRFHDMPPRPGDPDARFSLRDYRGSVREALRTGEVPDDLHEFNRLVKAVQSVKYGLIAVAERQFPLLLVPQGPDVVEQLSDVEPVRIFWDNEGGYLRRRGSTENLFSFDLPDELFALYARGRELEPRQAIRLKAERFAVLQALVVHGHRVRMVQFELDRDWIEMLLRR